MSLHDRIMALPLVAAYAGRDLEAVELRNHASEIGAEGDARIAELEGALASAEKKRQSSIRAARNQWLSQGGDLAKTVAYENEVLRKCLKEARENLEDWGCYVDTYFREKHDLQGDLAAIDKVLEAMMNKAPEQIYLIQGEWDGETGLTWCDCPAPTENHRPSEAVEYVRKDRHDARTAELETMVKVFRGCMESRLLPVEGSPCYLKVCEMVGENEE